MDDKLTGALIGLARAVDGNEHLITPESTAVIVDSLSAMASGSGDLEALLLRVEEEKRKIVPDCFFCACPCGRTDAYDMTNLRSASAEIKALKLELLNGILDLAARPARSEAVDMFFYKALFAIGMDGFGPDLLRPIVDEMHKLSEV